MICNGNGYTALFGWMVEAWQLPSSLPLAWMGFCFCGVKKARTDRRPDEFEAIAPNSANHVFGPPNKLEATQHFSRLQQKLNTVIKSVNNTASSTKVVSDPLTILVTFSLCYHYGRSEEKLLDDPCRSRQ